MKLGYSIEITENQLNRIINKYNLNSINKQIIPINRQIQLLMFYDKPVLFISGILNIEAFINIRTKYEKMLKHLGDENYGTCTKKR